MCEPHIVQKAPIAFNVEAGQSYYWCSCGKSANQPFCDSSHRGSEFRPVKYDAVETGTKYFCACKHTESQPLCDGSHAKLG
jgi:CDGSH iron-sulfur domain-containing protein 3